MAQCLLFYVYLAGKWSWMWTIPTGLVGRQCSLANGHPGDHIPGDEYESVGGGSERLRERAREMPLAAAGRRRVYAEDERRRAARALDHHLAVVMGDEYATDLQVDRASEFVQLVGDYVLERIRHNPLSVNDRLLQKSHYGVVVCRAGCRPDMPCDAERHAWAVPDVLASLASPGWCSCSGDTPTRLHVRGVPGCAHYGGEPAEQVRAERVATMPNVLASNVAGEANGSFRAYNPQDPSTHPPTCGCPVCVQ